MFNWNSRVIIIIVAFVAVCGLAAAGWMRKSEQTQENAVAAPFVASQPYGSSAYQNTPGCAQPATATAFADSGDGYYSITQRPLYVRHETYSQPVVDRQIYDERETYRGRTVRRGRSKTTSVEIVAGTAGVGAAIGAIAGGGKGAAIGAISGGAAGFAYDRMTHNH